MEFLPEVRFSKTFLNTLKKIDKQVKDKHLVNDIKDEYIRESRKGIIDKLTGLYNRRKFDEDIEHLFSQVDFDKKVHMSMILIDVDNFKLINDKFGHDRGDVVLQWVASTVRQCLRDRPGFRESGRVYRFGGEEFAILLPKTTPETSYVVSERVRQTIEKDTNRNITVSIGTSNTKDSTCNHVLSLVKSADVALYKAKTTGKNKIIINDCEENKIE